MKRVIAERGRRKAILMDSISYLDAGDAGHVVVAASHGGSSSARYALQHAPAAVFLDDAGVGKDDAGIAALAMLEFPAAAVSHLSARIGDAEDMWRNGVLSHVNASAAVLGLKAGDSV